MTQHLTESLVEGFAAAALGVMRLRVYMGRMNPILLVHRLPLPWK